MAQSEMNPPTNVVEKNIELTGQVMKFILDHPKTLDSLPDKFELVVLPEDDPEMCLYNLRLLSKHGREGKEIVFTQLKTHATTREAQPSFFVPIAA